MRRINSGQSVVEYTIIFAIVAALSVIMVANIPGIFSGYVTMATGRMR